MGSTRVFVNINGRWEELATCTDIKFDSEARDEFKGFGKSISGFGAGCIEFENYLIATNNEKLNNSFRQIKNLESWRGEGKRKMKVIK